MSRHNPSFARVQEQAQRLSYAMLDLLFPPRCAACGRANSGPLCDTCCQSFRPLGPTVCPQCSLPVIEPGRCARCQQEPPAFRQVMSGFHYEGALRKSILALKYKRKTALAGPLIMALPETTAPPRDCRICAVPMHPQRLAARGFNQAQLLANEAADRWGLDRIPVESFQRILPSQRQVGQSYSDRLANVRGAFQADPAAVAGEAVAVVDDVCTTGATLNACALALLEAGAKVVYGVTLARTVQDG